MIDPSSSEEESEEDQGLHHGGGGGGRGGSGSSHGSRHHAGSRGMGPGSGLAGSVGSASSGLTASPGGSSLGGHVGSAGTHGRSGGQTSAIQQEAVAAGLDVPNLSSARSSLSPSMSAAQDAANYAKSAQRPTSPSPSVASEKTEAELLDKQEREEEERKTRIQLYVFISRCIAYPFNAKQPTDMIRRQMKITKQQLETLCSRFQAFLKGETQIIADEAFHNAIQNYFDVFLKSERVVRMVQSGACSQHDFREVFKNNIEKRVRSLPEIDGLSKETVLTSWLAKFDCIFKGTGDEDSKRPSRMQQQSLNSELILSKEQLYDMFQQILGVKKFEHQLLFNALLLDSADEQAAAIRRELDGRIQRVNEMEKHQCHGKIDDLIDRTSASMSQGIINKLVTVLEATLSKLSRYDEGSLLGAVLSFTVSGSGREMGQAYVNFARNCMDQIRGKVIDELWIMTFFEQWYTSQIEMLCTWLSERLDHSLHLYQCTCLAHIVKKIYSDFELQAIAENKLNSKTYQTISQRMQTEEATCALNMSAQNEEGLSENGNDDDVDRPKTKVTIVDSIAGEDGNFSNISNVTSNVVGKVGSMFGKGIGGLSTKFGGATSWF